MPFININIGIAIKLLDDSNTLNDLLKEGKINPKEFDLLLLLNKLTQSNSEEKDIIKNTLRGECFKSFEKDAQRSFDLLVKFVENKQTVSWVLFSRSQQYIHYSEKNPLEGYLPRKNEIIKKLTEYKLSKV